MIFDKCCDPKTDMLPNKTYPKMITQVAFIPSGVSITTVQDYCFTELIILFHKKKFYVFGCGVNQEVFKLYEILLRNPNTTVIADIFKEDGNNYLVGKIEAIKDRSTKPSLCNVCLEDKLIELNNIQIEDVPKGSTFESLYIDNFLKMFQSRILKRCDNAIKRYCESVQEYNLVKAKYSPTDTIDCDSLRVIDTLTGDTVCGYKILSTPRFSSEINIEVITFDNQ